MAGLFKLFSESGFGSIAGSTTVFLLLGLPASWFLGFSASLVAFSVFRLLGFSGLLAFDASRLFGLLASRFLGLLASWPLLLLGYLDFFLAFCFFPQPPFFLKPSMLAEQKACHRHVCNGERLCRSFCFANGGGVPPNHPLFFSHPCLQKKEASCH